MFGRNNVEEDAKQFWEQKEKEKGGKVHFYTFATFLGRSGEKPLTLGGLIYTIDGTVYFEDFEKDSWFAKLVSRKSKYEKTEFSFNIQDIEEIKIVSKNSALNCISGFIDEKDTKQFSRFFSMLFQSAVQLRLNSGISLFFDIMRDKDFIRALRQS